MLARLPSRFVLNPQRALADTSLPFASSLTRPVEPNHGSHRRTGHAITITTVHQAAGSYKLGVLYVVDAVARQWIERAKQAGQAVSKNAAQGTYASGLQMMRAVGTEDVIREKFNQFGIVQTCIVDHYK